MGGNAMKKLTLLLTLLCANQLYGMEPEQTQGLGYFSGLPKDIHQEIIRALINSKNLEQAVQTVNIASALRGVRYDNIKDFTRLIHMLAKKFNTSPEKVAMQFKTSVATKYCDLCEKLKTTRDVTEAQKLIDDGADVNCSFLLGLAILDQKPAAMIELLLSYGANPHTKGGVKTALEVLNDMDRYSPEYEQIKLLLEEAMMKKQ
jgi:hypothetical protein